MPQYAYLNGHLYYFKVLKWVLPENVDQQFQTDVLNLCVQSSLPVSALASQGISIGARSEVTQLQVVVKLETLCPAHTASELYSLA